MQVLLVEDHVSTAKGIELMLQSLGHSCDWVESGESGMTLATRQAYDVILLDIMLPGMDGYEVLQELRAADIDTPIILQSGIVDRERAVQGLGLGVTDYLIKPYSKDEVAARIDHAVEHARLKAAESHDSPIAAEAAEGRIARRGTRTALLKAGQVIYQAATCVMDCIILNLSDHGAAIQPTDPGRLPSSFQLKIHHGPTFLCEVCWRHRNKLGVRFLET
jgi:DNA-binding response OmpR family regulator